MTRSFCILIITFLISSCGKPEYLSEKELIKFCQSEDNGLQTEKEIDDIKIKVVYRPTDLLVAQDLRSVANPSSAAISEARKKYGGHYYFVLSLSRNNQELLSPANQGLSGFSDLLQTVSFRMSERVNLTTKLDTVLVADYIYNRTFSLGASTDLMFVFEKSKIKEQEYLDFNLDEFGLGVGRQAFRFRVDDLENSPKIFQQ